MDLKKRAEELHHIPEPHYNCAQATFIPFAEEQGMDHHTMYQVAAQFRMRGGDRRPHGSGTPGGGYPHRR